MQKKDIIIGQDYALQEWEGQRPRRVRIVSFGNPRQVSDGGRSFRTHTVHDGIEVLFINAETGQPNVHTKVEVVELEQPIYEIGQPPVTTVEREVTYPSRGVVLSRHIKRTWEAQALANQSKAAMEADREVRIQTATETKNRVNRILKAHGLGTVTFGEEHSTRNGYQVNYGAYVSSPSVIRALIEIAGLTEDNGQAKQEEE